MSDNLTELFETAQQLADGIRPFLANPPVAQAVIHLRCTTPDGLYREKRMSGSETMPAYGWRSLSLEDEILTALTSAMIKGLTWREMSVSVVGYAHPPGFMMEFDTK